MACVEKEKLFPHTNEFYYDNDDKVLHLLRKSTPIPMQQLSDDRPSPTT
jgi:hypothetical protein